MLLLVQETGANNQAAYGPQATEAPPTPGSEARGAQRFTLLVRAAKLVADGREFLCVLRDASATGVKVRLFHDIPPAHELALELGNGERIPMQMVWQRDDHAGFRFDHEVDIRALLDDKGSEFPKRQLRLRVDRPAILHAHGVNLPGMLHNISQQGACIECDERLMLRERVRIEIPGFEPLYGKVCWRRQPRHGVVFERGFNLEELAQHLLRLQSGIEVDEARRQASAG